MQDFPCIVTWLSGCSDGGMRAARLLIAISFLLVSAVRAENWVVSFSSGPFVFGNFAENRESISVGGESETLRHALSAATRAGAIVEAEYLMSDRFSLRTEATFTRSPLSVKTTSDNDDPESEGVTLEVGELDVTTVALALAYHFNAAANLRPYVAVGPAYAIYDLEPETGSSSDPLFEGSRGRSGAIAVLGIEWWWKPQWRLRAEVADIITKSPLERSDFGSSPPATLEIRSPHNVHTSFGVGYRF